MNIKHTSYWQGEPLSQLSRDRLERAAETAISQMMEMSERDRQVRASELASLAFLAGCVLAGLGALTGVLLAH